MNDTSTSPIIMGLLFVLRCLVPLGILLGVSYLLRRMELIVDHAEEEENTTQTEEMPRSPVTPEPPKKGPASSRAKSGKKQKSGKKKPVTPKKRSKKQ